MHNLHQQLSNTLSLLKMQESLLILQNAQEAIEIILKSLTNSVTFLDQNTMTILNDEAQLMNEEITKLQLTIQKQLQFESMSKPS